MLKDEGIRMAIFVGLPMFLIGSAIFWYLMPSQEYADQNFLKALYFVGVASTAALAALRGLGERFRDKETTDRSKLIIGLIFIIILALLYYAISFFLNLYIS